MNTDRGEFEDETPTLECNPDNCRMCSPQLACDEFENAPTQPDIRHVVWDEEDTEHTGKEIGGES